MNIKPSLISACLGVAAFGAHADWQPAMGYVAGGAASHGAYSLTAGVAWPWQWQYPIGGGVLTAQGEAFLSHWSGRGATDRVSFTQVGVLPVLRYRFGAGWFAEGAIGLSATDRVYTTTNKAFSTRFNFADMLGAGRSFGADGAHELGVRVMHFSNAGIKHPNPGENFVLLRYARKF